MLDITEITDYAGHTDSDEPMSFIDYWDAVDDKMMELFGIDTIDADCDENDIAECQESGWSPLQYAEWYGEKYNLDRKGI